MPHIITESVIEYQPGDYKDWIGGKKDKWLRGESSPHVLNQRRYHFGEYFVLAHYAGQGWEGHRFYALGDWEPGSQKLKVGRAALATCFGMEQLAEFRKKRAASGRADGKGEPDLFLHKKDGARLFLEVKKDGDPVSQEQLQCLAQIRALLHADVGVVRVVPVGKGVKPKYYELDLIACTGKRVDV